jgi:hypothetical protein
LDVNKRVTGSDDGFLQEFIHFPAALARELPEWLLARVSYAENKRLIRDMENTTFVQ